MFPNKTGAPTNTRRDNHVPMANEVTGKLTPLGDYVYVEPELIDQHKTASGIIVAAPKRQGVPNTAKIVFLGPDVPANLKLEVGMRIVVNDPNMRGFHLNGNPVVPLKPENIIAVIEGQ